MKIYTLRLSVSFLLMWFACVAAPAQEKLFTYHKTLSSMPPDVGVATVAEYEITFNTSALARPEHDAVEFELPDGSRFMAEPKAIEYREKDSFLWRGNLKGNDKQSRSSGSSARSWR